jgi:hypothetical protein
MTNHTATSEEEILLKIQGKLEELIKMMDGLNPIFKKISTYSMADDQAEQNQR